MKAVYQILVCYFTAHEPVSYTHLDVYKRQAHVRGTADPFRQDIAGSDKSYPFHYEGNGNQLFVFEARCV